MSKRSERKGNPARKSAGAVGGFLRVLFRWLWLGLAWTSTVLFPIGLLVRLTLRDEVDALAAFYYATPWAVLAAGGLIAAWFWRGWKKVAWAVAAVAVLCAAAWIWTGFRFGPKSAGTADFRVAYWNCARPGWRLRGILPMASSWQADLLCFGESRPTGPLSPRWAEAFPGLRVQELSREMLLVGPGQATLKSNGSLGGAGQFQLCSAVLGGRELFILVVDFDALIGKSRRPAFDRLYQLVDAYATQPLLVLGDFNTPSDSVYFRRLRSRLDDAFEAAGTGMAATWPMPAPVLTLDHILVNKFLRVVRCEHRTSIYSDHRGVVAELAWR